MGLTDPGPRPSDPAEIDDFPMLWRELDRTRETRRWTHSRLAHEVERLSGQACSPKTVHDRMRHGRRVPWSEAVWFVKALDLDEKTWSARWAGVDDRRRGTAIPTPPTETAPVAEQPPVTEERRRPSRAVLPSWIIAGTAIVVLAALLLWQKTRREPDNPSDLLACALVAVDSADLFRAPGDPLSLATKVKGERITLPREESEVTGPDGRRYWLVRAPSRTPNGYAYMLADTLTLIPC